MVKPKGERKVRSSGPKPINEKAQTNWYESLFFAVLAIIFYLLLLLTCFYMFCSSCFCYLFHKKKKVLLTSALNTLFKFFQLRNYSLKMGKTRQIEFDLNV